MKVFISGKITGDPDYKEKFKNAENYIYRRFGADTKVMNPAFMCLDCGTREDYLLATIPMLALCDTIFLLNDYENSPGALVEFSFSKACEKKIIFQN